MEIRDPAIVAVDKTSAADPDPLEIASIPAGVSAAEDPKRLCRSPQRARDWRPYRRRKERNRNPIVRPIEMPDECPWRSTGIDAYLWSLYERTPKVDTNKVTEKIKTTGQGEGQDADRHQNRYRNMSLADFTWKDPDRGTKSRHVAQGLRDRRSGSRLQPKLYPALRAMDDAGFMPGITSAFRDDYRQSIAAGNKAASDELIPRRQPPRRLRSWRLRSIS